MADTTLFKTETAFFLTAGTYYWIPIGKS